MIEDTEESNDSAADELPDLDAAAPQAGHVSVLPEEILRLLDPKPGEIVLDCKLGRAGHASLITPFLGP